MDTMVKGHPRTMTRVGHRWRNPQSHLERIECDSQSRAWTLGLASLRHQYDNPVGFTWHARDTYLDRDGDGLEHWPACSDPFGAYIPILHRLSGLSPRLTVSMPMVMLKDD